jgi:hypothetical protein
MEFLGEHSNRKVFWWKYDEKAFEELPVNDWICFAIEDGLPGTGLFEKFAKAAINKNILEFKAYGNDSSILDDWFDETMVAMETMENHPEIDVMTTWHSNEGLASAFWQCFYATCLPKTTKYDNLKIVCFHFNDIDVSDKLRNYIKQFNDGWLPSDEE